MAGNRIAILPVEVSRRIAAGEVIEKPASVVRELIDNAIDAGAEDVHVTWTDGGSESIRVRDNGKGMSRSDLELCWQPHATSKIRTLEDLDHARSLGFRGEALASIAAVSELVIESTPEGERTGNRLRVRHAQLTDISPAPPRPGTSVTVQGLFANLPARRRFLSRAQAESRAIRNTILEKALPAATVRFSFPGTGKTERVLPAQTLVERTAEVFGNACPAQNLTELRGTGDGFTCRIVAAHPEVVRRDRRMISVYVNGRRVWEYKLIQAVEYAYQDVQHGGVFPVAAVFIEVEPELADFNIHPAKREVRLRIIGEIHHRVVLILRNHLRSFAIRAAQWQPELHDRSAAEGTTPYAPQSEISDGTGGDRSFSREREHSQAPGLSQAPGRAHAPSRFQTSGNSRTSGHPPAPSLSRAPGHHRPAAFEHTRTAVPATPLYFHGTVFGTYNLVEHQDKLYIIDQHAVHERLLYDRLAADRTPQALLVPEEIDTTSDQDRMLAKHQQEYRELGITLERVSDQHWKLTAIPAEYRFPIEVLVETILDLGGLQESFNRTFLAEIACKAALKAGDLLDQLTGQELARRALALEEPRCPHGRPLWVELDRERLDRLIGRK